MIILPDKTSDHEKLKFALFSGGPMHLSSIELKLTLTGMERLSVNASRKGFRDCVRGWQDCDSMKIDPLFYIRRYLHGGWHGDGFTMIIPDDQNGFSSPIPFMTSYKKSRSGVSIYWLIHTVTSGGSLVNCYLWSQADTSGSILPKKNVEIRDNPVLDDVEYVVDKGIFRNDKW